MIEKRVNDPAKYAEMAKPFETAADAENALEAFFEKVRALRESYRIAEVVVAAQVYVAGEPRQGRSSCMSLGTLVMGFALADAMRTELAVCLSQDVVDQSQGKHEQ